MCSGANFTITNGIEVSQYGGYYGGSLGLMKGDKVLIDVEQKQARGDIEAIIKENCTKSMLVEILAGIVKYADE